MPRFGIEFEGEVAKSLGRAGVRELLQSSSPWISSKSEAKDGYRDFSRWRVLSDSTVQASPDYEDIEVASPIISSPDEVFSAWQVWQRLRDLGVRELADTAGVHIHLEWPKPDPTELLVARLLLNRCAPELYRFLGVSPARASRMGEIGEASELWQTARSLYSELGRANQATVGQNGESASAYAAWRRLLIDCANSTSKRFNGKKTFLRYTPYGTLEFRALNSTLDFEAVHEAKNLLLHLIYFALSHADALFDALRRPGSWDFDLEKILNTTGYPRDRLTVAARCAGQIAKMSGGS